MNQRQANAGQAGGTRVQYRRAGRVSSISGEPVPDLAEETFHLIGDTLASALVGFLKVPGVVDHLLEPVMGRIQLAIGDTDILFGPSVRLVREAVGLVARLTELPGRIVAHFREVLLHLVLSVACFDVDVRPGRFGPGLLDDRDGRDARP